MPQPIEKLVQKILKHAPHSSHKEFSRCCQAMLEIGSAAQKKKSRPEALDALRRILAEANEPTADNVIGQLAVWGGESSHARQQLNLSLRVGAVRENQRVSGMAWSEKQVDDLRSRQFAPALVVPWPEDLPKSHKASHGSSGISSLIPQPLPPEGQAFPIFQYEITDRYEASKDEALDFSEPADLKVTVTLMARRLPLQSPRPHKEEIDAVTALRDRGFVVCQEGSTNREYEGNDGGRATWVYGGQHDVNGSTMPRDDDMRQIGTLPDVQEVDLWRANVTDEGLEQFAELKQLKTLDIRFDAEANVTSEGIGAICRITTLERLRLEGIQVTDEAAPHLRQLTNLKELYIYRGSELSAEAIEQLEAALPQADITCR